MTLSKKYLFLGVILFLAGGCRFWNGEAIKLSGTVEVTEYALSFPLPVHIAEVRVDEGDAVREGDVLALSDRYAQTAKERDRLTSLYKAGGADLQTVEHAELAAADHRIESPVDGEVLVQVRRSGETAGAGMPVVIVGDIGHPWVRVYVPEGKIQHVRRGQKARIRLDGARGDLEGEVFYISPKAEFTPRNVQTAEERVTQTFLVKIRIINPENVLPGVFADVEFGRLP